MELSHRSMHTHVCGVRGILCSGLKLSGEKKKEPNNNRVSEDLLKFEDG